MAKAKSKKTKESSFSGLDFSDVFDDVENQSKLQSIEVKERLDASIAISSGSLQLDVAILGGGYYPGRAYDWVGPESGGKTTTGNSALANALTHIPKYTVGHYYDFEGSLDTRWFMNIAGRPDDSPDEVFGRRNKRGEWEVKPRIRLYKPRFGEQGLLLMIKHLNSLPDKALFMDEWWYTWTPVEAKVKKKTGGLLAKDIEEMLRQQGVQWDKDFLKKNRLYGIRVPENYGGCEGLIFVDSWAAMTPQQTAEDDSAAMAQQGRMFGTYINQVKNLLSIKGWTCIGVNQVRLNPNARFGSPEYSPGGEALKHFCDCRNRIGAVSNQNGSGQTELENHGLDEYKHFIIRNRKNKVTTPYGEISGRWWVKRNGQTGCGLDPVLDTIKYLELTGQLEKSRKGYIIKLQDKSKAAQHMSDIVFKYEDFKAMVLNGQVDTGKNTVKFNIRKHCFKQIKQGLGMELYYNNNDIENTDNEQEDDDND